MEGHRLQRATEALREEITELISFELEDPRLDGVEVVDLTLDPKMRYAHVQVRVAGDAAAQKAALAALEGARGYIKSELTLRVPLPHLPELRFEEAGMLGSPERVQSLLKRIKKGRPKDAPQ